MTLSTGGRLGPYEIIAPIGAGGMGEVYRALDTRLGRTVAIKVLLADFATDTERLRRFEQEARAVGALNHPNILVLHDIGTHDSSPYLVSEFLEGETLREVLGRGPLPLRKVVDYARDIALGLAAAHEKGIIHRDLKPENIFLTKSGHLKILDFGLAKLASSNPILARGSGSGDQPTENVLSQPGFVMGTMGYMSPEQVRGLDLDARSDIFAFGAVLYEMLCGQRAFRGDSVVESLNAILKQEPPELPAAGGTVPAGLDSILKRCLEKDPAQRFRSAHDLAFSLATLGTLSGAVAAPAAPVRAQRRPLVVLAAVAAAGALFAAGWFVAHRSRGAVDSYSFRQITFQQGQVFSARFAPDGETIVYSAQWDGGPSQVYTTRPGTAEFRSLDLPRGTSLLAVSSAGDLALRMPPSPGKPGPILARVPLAGGVPRSVLESVVQADWGPGGKDLAIVRMVSGVSRLEFPVGTKLTEVAPPSRIGRIRVSPKGDLVTFVEHPPGQNTPGHVCVVDREGKKRVLTKEMLGVGFAGIAWSPDGSEIYFQATEAVAPPTVRAVDLKGRMRQVLKAFGELILYDVFPGRLLVGHTSSRMFAAFLGPGQASPRDLGWLDWSMPVDLSPDGKLLLFDETRAGAPASGSVYLRPTDGAPPVRLGDGQALALSRDGAWAATVRQDRSELILLPTGPGEARPVRGGKLSYGEARFLPDGRALVVLGNEPGHQPRLYVQDIESGATRAITPEGVSRIALSPDGSRVACVGADGRVRAYSVATEGEGEPVAAAVPGDAPIQWSADGNAIFVSRRADVRQEIYRLELKDGRRELWKTLAPSEPAAALSVRILLTPDGNSSVLAYSRYFYDLYLVEGAS